jgi:hypothetical protein
MALVNYLGFCLIAISVLPVDKSTIKYGSCDAGNTMHFDNMELYAKIKEGCQKLNLKPHKSGLEPKSTDPDQYGPGDIEGHLGKDGRFYMLDFARLMPPECPLPNQIIEKGSLFFKLLRPELVRGNCVPLSSDALTRWGMGDPHRMSHNKEVLEATIRLRTDVISRFAGQLALPQSEMELSKSSAITFSDSICHRLHGAGINLRHLGLVRRRSTNSTVQSLLLVEMLARIFKCKLNEKLRRAITSDVGVAFEKCRTLVAHTLALCLSIGDNTTKMNQFWLMKLKSILEIKFPGGLSEEEQSESHDFRIVLTSNYGFREILLSRFLTLTGTQLSCSPTSILDANVGAILPSDVLTLVPRTKNMVIGDVSFAFSKYMQAIRSITSKTPNYSVTTRLLQHVLIALQRAPEFNSLFHDKMVSSTLKELRGKVYDDIPFMLKGKISEIVSFTLGQRPGDLAQAEALAISTSSYLRASRMLRYLGSFGSARDIMQRAGIGSLEAKLELFRCQVRRRRTAPHIIFP